MDTPVYPNHYSVRSYIPRNTTCPIACYRIYKDDKPSSREFSKYQDAVKMAAILEMAAIAKTANLPVTLKQLTEMVKSVEAEERTRRWIKELDA